MRILILGGGPCGLGAAWRLNEMGHDDWLLCEKNNYWGGLSASFQDEDGFIWDLGGHVLFSHYPYFDQVMNTILDKHSGWVYHEREAWVWMQDRFVPYPLQNNIHRLPKDVYWECLQGIVDIQKNNSTNKPHDFAQWINATFGIGLAKWFMNPYNFKVWAYPPDQMDWSWVGERVAPVDLKQVLKNAIYEQDTLSWGPNSLFQFPLYGGTGAIWMAIAKRLPPDKLHLNSKVSHLSILDKEVFFEDGSSKTYDILLSTLPLTHLVKMADLKCASEIDVHLKYSSSHIVGLALKGNIPENLATKCWIYFPEANCPFYRVTVFSNYSPNNVPDKNCQWSLMCEVSQSPMKPVDSEKIVQDVIEGALNTKLIHSRNQIHHTWKAWIDKGYPTPSLDRNQLLFPVLSDLKANQIYSRGRFGAWRYEVGNMDHSFMQGVEFANHLIASEQELTLWNPSIANRL